MIYKRATEPAFEPISIEQARMQIGLDSADSSMDTLLTPLITAAREYVEKYTNRSLITADWTAYMDTFDTWAIELFKVPISELTTLKYYDTDNVEKTLIEDTDYNIDIISEPARLFPASGESWPDTYDKPNAIEIAFKSGYGATAASVPKTIQAVMLMIVTHLEANRGDEGFRTMPSTIDLLLNDYRLQIL